MNRVKNSPNKNSPLWARASSGISSGFGNACALDGTSIVYDADSIDIKADPTQALPVSAFEAVFLTDIIKEIKSDCLVVTKQCKTQYPDINESNWKKWITSIDQENRVSLAHTLERANFPILYNTPRMCDPGVNVSLNWSLKKYIESRLYLFRYVYGFSDDDSQILREMCYPGVIFDFRPFEYKFKGWGKEITVTQWITVDDESKSIGYTPRMALSSGGMNIQKNSSMAIFQKMTKLVVEGRDFGNSASSILNKVEFSLKNTKYSNNTDRFLKDFTKFVQRYDGALFDVSVLFPASKVSVINLTPDVVRVLYYDLVHDKVLSKKNDTLAKFSKEFENQFVNFKGREEHKKLIGAALAGNSYAAYKTIFQSVNQKKFKKVKNKNQLIPQFPAIFKTLGDLSQYMYAGKYKTIVASGDKMGLAAGIYINAKQNSKVRVMMEDVITGFVVYMGINNIKFTRKFATCGVNGKTGEYCTTGKPIDSHQWAESLIKTLPVETQKQANIIIKKKPIITSKLLNLWMGAGTSNNKLAEQIFSALNTNKYNFTNLKKSQKVKIESILRAYMNSNSKYKNTARQISNILNPTPKPNNGRVASTSNMRNNGSAPTSNMRNNGSTPNSNMRNNRSIASRTRGKTPKP